MPHQSWVLASALLVASLSTAAQLSAPIPSTVAAPSEPTRHDALHALVANHTRIPYTSAGTDTWDVLSQADEDPAHPGYVLMIYGNSSLAAVSSGNNGWEREHTWPVSYGLTDNNPCDSVYTDLHHLRPSESALNQSRGNKPFGFCVVRDCSPKPLLDGSGRANRTWGKGNEGVWEVWPGRRGDVARGLMYLDVRYDGGQHAVTGCHEPDLRLTSDRSLITTADGPVDVAYMGILNDLIVWSREDPPDAAERHRNDVIERYQGNRNPFIDHPDWVCDVWPNEQACGGWLVVLPWVGSR